MWLGSWSMFLIYKLKKLMYSASLNITELNYVATLNFAGEPHVATFQKTETTFVATLSQTIRMLPDVLTNQRIEALEQSTDGLLNGSDFEAYYILSRDN